MTVIITFALLPAERPLLMAAASVLAINSDRIGIAIALATSERSKQYITISVLLELSGGIVKLWNKRNG